MAEIAESLRNGSYRPTPARRGGNPQNGTAVILVGPDEVHQAVPASAFPEGVILLVGPAPDGWEILGRDLEMKSRRRTRTRHLMERIRRSQFGRSQ